MQSARVLREWQHTTRSSPTRLERVGPLSERFPSFTFDRTGGCVRNQALATPLPMTDGCAEIAGSQHPVHDPPSLDGVILAKCSLVQPAMLRPGAVAKKRMSTLVFMKVTVMPVCRPSKSHSPGSLICRVGFPCICEVTVHYTSAVTD